MENRLTVQPSLAHRQDDQETIERNRLFGLLEAEIDDALTALSGTAPLMMTMARYHLGLTDSSGEATSPEVRRAVQGKRIRPLLAMYSAAAVGGRVEEAAPVAAGIELLHNFTLIHDDIQDRSPNRRYRPTVWRIWGNAQAINAGDALFAAAQLALLRINGRSAPPSLVVRLIEAFNTTTIDIVRGQVHDLENEGRPNVTPEDYLTMIAGKTAAIVRYSAWAGALVGGASDEIADELGQVGEAIGMGFQLRDDMLGIWSPAAVTGKDAADDIRRRKQSLPILILRARASDEDTKRLNGLFLQEEIGPEGVLEVLALLTKYDVEETMTAQVEDAHTRAMSILEEALPNQENAAIESLKTLVTQLSVRIS